MDRSATPSGEGDFAARLGEVTGILERRNLDGERTEFLAVDDQPNFLIEMDAGQGSFQPRFLRRLLQFRQQLERGREQLRAFGQSGTHHAVAPFVAQSRARSAIDIRFGQGQPRCGDHDGNVACGRSQHGALGDPFEFDAVDIEVRTALEEQRSVASHAGGADEKRTLVGNAEAFAEIFGQQFRRALPIAQPFDAQTPAFRLIEDQMNEQIFAGRRGKFEGDTRTLTRRRDRWPVHPGRQRLSRIERQIRGEDCALLGPRQRHGEKNRQGGGHREEQAGFHGWRSGVCGSFTMEASR